MLCDEGETGLFVEVSRSVQALKGPELDLRVTLGPATIDGGVDELIADASAARGIRHDEPPQMGSLGVGMAPVDRN